MRWVTLLSIFTVGILFQHASARPTILVHAGESIQGAVKKAQPGTVVLVEPGVYSETITVDRHNITLKGLVMGDLRPTLDGKGKLSDAVIASGDQFAIEGFRMQNYQANGVTTQGSHGVVMRDLIIENTGRYGVYPVESQDILIERCIVSKIKDAGIYVGQSKRAVVRYNEAKENVAGIEIENTIDAKVEDNYVHDNTGGILVFVLPGLVQKVGERALIEGNKIFHNNTANFADPKSIVAKVPPGTGLLILAADATTIVDNEIRENGSFGIALAELSLLENAKQDPAVQPNPDDTHILNNLLVDNGKKPQGLVQKLLGKGADVIWTGKGKGNCLLKEPQWTLIGAQFLPRCKKTEPPSKTAPQKAPRSPKKNERPQKIGEKGSPAPQGVLVAIRNMRFEPLHLTVPLGAKVTWVNKDNVTHTVTSGKGPDPDPKPLLDSGFMDPGGVYSYTFKKAGTYTYLCLPHRYQEGMRDATITVKPK